MDLFIFTYTAVSMNVSASTNLYPNVFDKRLPIVDLPLPIIPIKNILTPYKSYFTFKLILSYLQIIVII